MADRSESILNHRSYGYLLIIVLGLLISISVCIASMDKKWMVAVALGLVGFFGFFIIARDYRKTFLLFAILIMPIKLDFNLIFKITPYAQLKGLPITIFDLMIFVLIFYWIFQLIQGSEKIKIFPMISIPAFVYIFLATISAFKSEDTVLSFSMILLTIKCYIIFIYFANNIKTKNDVLLILGGLAVGVLLQSGLGMLQYLTGGTLGMEIFGESERGFRTANVGYRAISRVGGTIGDPNALAMYLNFILPPILAMVFTDTPLKYRVGFAMLFILGGITEILTLSRGGWIALSFGSTLVLYAAYKGIFKGKMKSLFMMTISLILIGSFLLIGSEDVRDRLFEDDYGSAESRVPMMQVAFNVIKNNPLSGVGLNNYSTVMKKYDRTNEYISYKFPYPVHNAFLIIAGESGILALICFLLVLFGAFIKSLRFYRLEDKFLSLMGIGFFSSIITWSAHAQIKMDFAGINTVIWFSLGMIIAIEQMLKNRIDNNS